MPVLTVELARVTTPAMLGDHLAVEFDGQQMVSLAVGLGAAVT